MKLALKNLLTSLNTVGGLLRELRRVYGVRLPVHHSGVRLLQVTSLPQVHLHELRARLLPSTPHGLYRFPRSLPDRVSNYHTVLRN